MTDAPKLLTEAEWFGMLSHDTIDEIVGLLRARGLIAEEPLSKGRLAAMKVVAECHDVPINQICHDGPEVELVLKGMEIEREAASPLTRERVREACRVAYNGWGIPDDFVSRLHAALTGEGRHDG